MSCLYIFKNNALITNEVREIVQEVVIKTTHKKNKCKKVKWFSEGDLQIAEERKEATAKGEMERYTHVNGEIQRIAGRIKKAFLRDQWEKKKKKKIEEGSRIGKTGDLFKKIREARGTFHAK